MGTMSAAYMREYRARQVAERDGDGLLPFQAAFVSAVCREKRPPELAALSVPRGNGKSWLCGGLVARSLTPGGRLFEPNVENILVSASRSQAGIVLDFARAELGESSAYRWRADGVIHKETRTRVRVISSDSRRALGLGANVRLIVADEPGAWGPRGRASALGCDYHGVGEAAHNGRSGRHAGPGTVDGPGVVVAVVCGVWKFGWATRRACSRRTKRSGRDFDGSRCGSIR